MRTYRISGNEFRITDTSLGDYLKIVRLMETMKIKQPFEIKGSGEALVYVGRFLDELVTKRALARFFALILRPIHPMPLWILGALIPMVRSWILLKVSDHQAIEILNDFFLAKKELWEKLVANFSNLKSGKKK